MPVTSSLRSRQSLRKDSLGLYSPARGGAKMDTPEDLRGFNTLFVVTQVIGLVGIVMMAVWTANYRGGFAWTSTPKHQFNWHPLLLTIGMIYLFANSILVYRALRTIRKKTLKLIHAAIHIVVIVLIIIAFIAVLDSHNYAVPPVANFYSLHSWMGLIAVGLYLLQWAAGFAVFWYPGFPMNLRAAIMPIHTFMGLLAFVMSLATACTGLTEKALFSVTGYKEFVGETYLINFMGIVFFLFGVLVVYLATEVKYKRYPRPEDEGLISGS